MYDMYMCAGLGRRKSLLIWKPVTRKSILFFEIRDSTNNAIKEKHRFYLELSAPLVLGGFTPCSGVVV